MRAACAQVAAFPAIPPSADRASFRAQTNVGTVDGLSAESRPQAEVYSAEARELDDKLEKLAGELRELDDATEREQRTARLAEDYAEVAKQLVDREMTEPGPAVKAWQTAFDRALQARLAAAATAEKNGARRRTLERQRRRALRQARAAERGGDALDLHRRGDGHAVRRAAALASSSAISSAARPGRRRTRRAPRSAACSSPPTRRWCSPPARTGRRRAGALDGAAARPPTPPELATLRSAPSSGAPRKVIVGREELPRARRSGRPDPARPAVGRRACARRRRG